MIRVANEAGALAKVAAAISDAGVNLNLVYVATGTRIVFGADDIGALRAALGVAEEPGQSSTVPGEAEVEVPTGRLL